MGNLAVRRNAARHLVGLRVHFHDKPGLPRCEIGILTVRCHGRTVDARVLAGSNLQDMFLLHEIDDGNRIARRSVVRKVCESPVRCDDDLVRVRARCNGLNDLQSVRVDEAKRIVVLVGDEQHGWCLRRGFLSKRQKRKP